MKPLAWLATSLADVKAFPIDAKREIGFQLFKVQSGLEPSDWKRMLSVGTGVTEIRVHGKNEYRVLYVAKFEEAIYVVHAFVKKTRQTSRHDIEVAAARYRWLLREREGQK